MSDSSDADSRRRHFRVDLEVHVDVISGTQFFAAASQNLSVGGIFVATEDCLPVGTQIDVSFTVPGDAESFFAVGQVRWIRLGGQGPSGMGIQFLGLSQSDEVRLEALVATMDIPNF